MTDSDGMWVCCGVIGALLMLLDACTRAGFAPHVSNSDGGGLRHDGSPVEDGGGNTRDGTTQRDGNAKQDTAGGSVDRGQDRDNGVPRQDARQDGALASDVGVRPLNWSGAVFSAPVVVASLRSSSRERPLSLSPDGLTLYLASNRPGGPGGYDLWVTHRATRDAPFSAPTLLQGVNTAGDEMSASISPDQLSIYLVRRRGASFDLWRASRTDPSGAFSTPVQISELSSSSDELWPVISADGLQILFSSARAGGLGMLDYWIATRESSTAAFSTPHNLSELNSPVDEWEIIFTPDGLAAILASDRAGGQGRADLWLSVRTSIGGTFGPLIRLGALSSADDEADPVLSVDGRELFFGSDRPDGLGMHDVMVSQVSFP